MIFYYAKIRLGVCEEDGTEPNTGCLVIHNMLFKPQGNLVQKFLS